MTSSFDQGAKISQGGNWSSFCYHICLLLGCALFIQQIWFQSVCNTWGSLLVSFELDYSILKIK